MLEATVQTETPAVSSPVEAEARMFGWKPLEEFNGSPERWRDAEAFLEKGRQINGFLRKDFDKLRGELTARDTRIAALEESIQEFANYHKETEARAYQRAVVQLKNERKEALRMNDGERVVAIEEQMDELQEASQKSKLAPRAVAPRASDEPDPAFVAWVDSNPWYKENRVLRSLTHDYAEELKRAEPSLVGPAFLNKVKALVQENHPELFHNPERARPGAVAGGAETRGSRSNGKTYHDLPAEAKAACDKFVAKGFLKREDYVRDYYQDSAE